LPTVANCSGSFASCCGLFRNCCELFRSCFGTAANCCGLLRAVSGLLGGCCGLLWTVAGLLRTFADCCGPRLTSIKRNIFPGCLKTTWNPPTPHQTPGRAQTEPGFGTAAKRDIGFAKCRYQNPEYLSTLRGLPSALRRHHKGSCKGPGGEGGTKILKLRGPKLGARNPSKCIGLALLCSLMGLTDPELGYGAKSCEVTPTSDYTITRITKNVAAAGLFETVVRVLRTVAD
jgi:hypothetical protein